jgi:ABC-type uncharacterized transport system substrate-binding protein
MDVSHAGPALQELLTSWAPELTRQGYAVLEAGDQVKIATTILRLPVSQKPELVAGTPVRDFRAQGAQS